MAEYILFYVHVCVRLDKLPQNLHEPDRNLRSGKVDKLRSGSFFPT